MSTFVEYCFQLCILKFENGDTNNKRTENTNSVGDCDSSCYSVGDCDSSCFLGL